MESILIVDDVQTDRDILGQLVTQAGYRAVYANDGAEALTVAKAVCPALVLLDVVMPGQDGFKTCRTLPSDPETRGIPIVLVTSKGGDSDRFWGKKQGAEDHVAKPYTAESMQTIIRRFVR